MTAQNQRDPDGTDILGQVRDGLADLKANVISRWGRVPHVASDPATLADGMVWTRSDDRGLRWRANGTTISPVRWELTHSTTQSVVSAVATDIIWDTETADPQNVHAASAATIVAPFDGVYQCSYTIRFAASGTGARAAWLECSRGSTRYGYQEHGPDATRVALTGSCPIYATAGQTIKVVVFHAAVGNLNYTDIGPTFNNFCGGLIR